MSKHMVTSLPKVDKVALSDKSNTSTLVADLKSLFKGFVLVANVLPVLTGFWLALHFTNNSFATHWDVFLLTIIGSTFVVAGALTLNNWYEVDLDQVMERTQARPTVTGNLSLNAVLTIGISLSILGFILLLFTTVEATIYAAVGWITYVIFYTMWSKRKYTLNTAIGSLSGAVTPLIGWAAVTSSFHIVPIVIGLLLFIWQMPHTFAIAMRRCEEYRRAGVAMLPVVHGFDMTKRQIMIYVACLLPLPFFLSMFGTVFMVVATVLNIAWLVLAFAGFFTKDDVRWAYRNFLFSVNYMTILLLLMMIVVI